MIKFPRFASLLAVAGCCALYSVQAENSAAVNEVLKLKNAGVGEDTIVAYIQGKNINYDLSADSILALKDKGLTPVVVNAMLSSGMGVATPSGPDPRLIAPQPQVPVPQR